MKFVRWFLGRLILAVNYLTPPTPIVRDPQAQAAVDALTANMSIYQFAACPFCVKVRRQLRRQGLNIELRDAQNDPAYAEELIREGGKRQVPCLRIENGPGDVKWLYESKAISAFLQAEFGGS